VPFADGRDEAFVRRALDQAFPNALRMALYQASRDPDLLKLKSESQPFWGGAWRISNLGAAAADVVRRKALSFLATNPVETAGAPEADVLRQMMDNYGPRVLSEALHRMGAEAIAFDEFPRGVEWSRRPSQEALRGFKVAVIGAGVGGIAAAIQLERLGIPYTVFERNKDVGGTWAVNNYPDARVDVASYHYQYSFVKRYPWQNYFATGEEVHAYLLRVAADYGVLPHICLQTSVTGASWQQRTRTWRLTISKADKPAEVVEVNAVISAAGLFNAPNMPDIQGIETFAGKSFHTTAWDSSYDYAGKRVGVIGTGSTGAQLVPRVARDAAAVKVFQRTPGWVSAIEGYRAPITEESRWLLARMPYYWNWYCFGLFHMMFDDIEGLTTYDPDWQAAGGLISERNDLLRRFNTDYILSKVGHRPGMADKLTPSHPPFAQRPIVDNGWFDALNRPNVELVTERIARITPRGVVTDDGIERELDLLVLSTGFKTARYLWPVRYQGADGRTLEEVWEKDGARAYLGLTVPDFPNLFMLYGPNAQCRTGGLFFWLEVWARYSVQAVVNLIEGGHRSMVCRRDTFEKYNCELDEEMRKYIWNIEGQKSYFLNEHGRIGVFVSLHPVEYFERLRTPNMADFDIL
jgi:4-hydroxyacetophenone monooxygenase